MKIGIIGAGTMGAGIAQVASQSKHPVVLFDVNSSALAKARAKLEKIMHRLIEKGRVSSEEAQAIQDRISYSTNYSDFTGSTLVIEAIVENHEIKTKVFRQLEDYVDEQCLIASNTSSLSIAALAASSSNPTRFLGIHFFNPAPLMPLVEIIPAIQTSTENLKKAKDLIDSWGKVTVMAKDTPGFIVNRVARPFYGEALRIYDEGLADIPTIDWAMKEIGGFRMGPFQLMDYIGNDINYTVTETVFKSFFYDPRYKPSFTQKRMAEAGYLGRKAGRGYYDYSEDAVPPEAQKDQAKGEAIVNRIVMMLINEAADALYLNIASKEDIDLAMTKGVNYPKGLLKWADEKGIAEVVKFMDALHQEYLEDRYRVSPLLRRMARDDQKFYP